MVYKASSRSSRATLSVPVSKRKRKNPVPGSSGKHRQPALEQENLEVGGYWDSPIEKCFVLSAESKNDSV